MFARIKDIERDDVPLWAWILILPGLVIVAALVLRQLRSQARLAEARPELAHEVRLESSRRGSHPQQSEVTQYAAEAEDTGEIARPVDRKAVKEAAEQSADVAEARNATVPEETQVAEVASRETSQAPAGDDLKVVEGIGPKIEAILKEAGIYTFRDLANTSLERLYQVLHAANLRMADPGTWAEQARLAADGNWDYLKALQDRTNAGRRSIED
jgi:predicted flap endonuclease-1-like 5' DNA nuclease